MPFLKQKIQQIDVIPAKAGIQSFSEYWIPAFAGMTVNC